MREGNAFTGVWSVHVRIPPGPVTGHVLSPFQGPVQGVPLVQVGGGYSLVQVRGTP